MEFMISFYFPKSVVLIIPLASFITKVDGVYIRTCNGDGMFTAVFDNGSSGCSPCTDCPDGSRISQPCRYNSDTVCEQCPPETYVAQRGNECRKCTRCPPGFYVAKRCHNNHDRLCTACTRGYYSRHWNSLSCRRCRRCKQKENVIEPCSRRNNSICGDCDKDHYRESSTWNCVPCSKCEGKDYVMVKECMDKQAEGSNYICQPQAYIPREPSGTKVFPSVTTVFTTDSDALLDTFTVTISAMVGLVICLALLVTCAFLTWQSHLKCHSVGLRPCRSMTSNACEYRSASAEDIYEGENKRHHATVSVNPDISNLSCNDSEASWRQIYGNEHFCCPGLKTENQQNEKLSLLNCEQLPIKNTKKKRRRKLRSECWQSDSNILNGNPYAVLEASMYTTI